MTTITRRDALRASGLALAGGWATSSYPRLAVAQTGNVSSSAVSTNTASADLQAFVVSNIPQYIARAQNGTLGFSDCMELSSRMRLSAHHISTLNTDSLRMSVVSSLDTSHGRDLTQIPGVAQAWREIAKYAPSFTEQSFQSALTLSQSDLEAGRQSLAQHSIDWHFSAIADKLAGLAYIDKLRMKGATGTSPTALPRAPMRPHLSYAVYTPATHARLQTICVVDGIQITVTQVCQLIFGLISLGSGLAALLCGVAPSASGLATLAAAVGFSLPAFTALLAGIAIIAGYYLIWC